MVLNNRLIDRMGAAEQTREIIRCGKDPTYFINEYVKIQHPLKGIIQFETYDFQDECVAAFQEHRYNIVLKSRQLGLSTVCAAYALWLAIFYKGKSILIIATKKKTADNMLKKVNTALQNLPRWLVLPTASPTKDAINFSNGSSITSIPTSDDAGRSEALSLLIIDEAAFIKNFESIWTGLAPTVSTGGNAIILSTPNGVGGQYYRLWTEAEAGTNGFNPIRIPWDRHPEHDQAWFDKETRNLPRRRVSQEFLCDFQASGDTFLQPDDLEELRAQIRDPIAREGQGNSIWVWAHPLPNRSYIIGADVSRGDAKDYSAFHVLDAETCEVAVEYMGKVPPEKLANILFDWGKRYNDALVVPENNTYGYFVNNKLRDVLGYKRLFYKNSTNQGDPFNYFPTDPKHEQPGFNTNQKTRVQVLARLEEFIRSRKLVTRSRRLYDQLQAFVWEGQKPTAGKDSHDDLIISLAIACWLVQGAGGVSEQARATAYAMLAATNVHRKGVEHMPGGINEAQPLVDPNIRGINANSVYRTLDGSRTSPRNPFARSVSDFSWLTR